MHERSGADFEHDAFTEVLEEIVDDAGRVDYARLARSPEGLDAYLDQLASLDYAALSRDAKLATLINAYNAFTLRLILDHLPLESIRDIPAEARWEAERWSLGGEELSLDEIEHVRLRGQFREPRIHFAINCASESCPPLSPTAFETATLQTQLTAAAERFHDPDQRWFGWHPAGPQVRLSRIYLWFDADFKAAAGSELAFAARYHQPLAEAVAEDAGVEVDYMPYDWSLNEARPAGGGPE